jgi:hypothetical protein
MSDDMPILDAALAARVSRLPLAIEPPVDLWPAIAARLGRDRDAEALDVLLRRLAPELDTAVDLWPAIESRLERRTKVAAAVHAAPSRSWVAMAASLAAVTIMASIAALMFATTETITAPTGNDVARAVDTIRIELAKVQGERLAIEESLQLDGDNLTLHALWAHAYQTELDLAGKAERLMEGYPGV